MTTEEKLQHFQQATMENARTMSNKIITEYRQALDKIFEEHKEEKCRQAKLQIKTESDSIKKENNKVLAQEQLHIKRKLTKKHNELKEKLFVEAKDLLEQYMATPAYDQFLIDRINEAKNFAKGEQMIIYIDPADVKKRMQLEASTGVELTVSEYTFWGGIRAIITKRNILIDYSFASKLEEAKENFRFKGGSFHE